MDSDCCSRCCCIFSASGIVFLVRKQPGRPPPSFSYFLIYFCTKLSAASLPLHRLWQLSIKLACAHVSHAPTLPTATDHGHDDDATALLFYYNQSSRC